ncbi:MAG TPA: universal stress protein [Actinomycetota bacterium]|nr:universal stress protein [Actinomycetota bacterium]
MSVFGHLVVGTDGSDSAWRAVEHAVRLGGALDAGVVVTNAYPPPGSPRADRVDVYPGPEVGASILRDVAESFEDAAELRCELRAGDPVDVLIEVALEASADAIVVGNRGMGRRRTLLGAVPSKVAHRAPCSVLIAHTTGAAPPPPYRRVLIGTDGSPTATRAVEVGGALAAGVGADILLARAGDDGAEGILRDAAGRLPASAATRAVEGEPAAALTGLARAEGCDLIVVGNKGMTGARRFLSSVPSRVAHHAGCHVLLVKTT